MVLYACANLGSNLTNKYNPQEPYGLDFHFKSRSNLTNKYNPQEHISGSCADFISSNLTNKYNPQELLALLYV